MYLHVMRLIHSPHQVVSQMFKSPLIAKHTFYGSFRQYPGTSTYNLPTLIASLSLLLPGPMDGLQESTNSDSMATGTLCPWMCRYQISLRQCGQLLSNFSASHLDNSSTTIPTWVLLNIPPTTSSHSGARNPVPGKASLDARLDRFILSWLLLCTPILHNPVCHLLLQLAHQKR